LEHYVKAVFAAFFGRQLAAGMMATVVRIIFDL